MTRKAFLRECRESQAASIRRYLVETTGLHRNMVNSVRSTTEAPAICVITWVPCLSGFACFKELMGAVSRSKWCAVSTSRNSASSRTTLTNKRCLPRCRLWHLSDYTHTDFTHGKIYRHPYCKRALYRLIDARVTCPIQRAKTPDSLCYIICLVGKVLSLENTALPQFNVAASPHPTWLYKSWRMFAGKLR